jgi:hypothetical protein
MTLNTEQMADTPLALWRAADGVDHSGNGLNLTPFGAGRDCRRVAGPLER